MNAINTAYGYTSYVYHVKGYVRNPLNHLHLFTFDNDVSAESLINGPYVFSGFLQALADKVHEQYMCMVFAHDIVITSLELLDMKDKVDIKG